MTAHTKGPTLEEMHEVWLRRKRASWPATFEAAMDSEILRRILMIETLYVGLRRVLPGVVQDAPPLVSLPVTFRRRSVRAGFWMDSQGEEGSDPTDGA